jgi:hypothetical protein
MDLPQICINDLFLPFKRELRPPDKIIPEQGNAIGGPLNQFTIVLIINFLLT